jgi:predicted MFS family arabinose efflux permease
MAVNFIGPLLMLSGIASLVGIIFGLVKKDKKIVKISLIAFVIIALIFIVL